jgi:hypothetical protein
MDVELCYLILKQREAFGCDCANLLFPHCFPSGEMGFCCQAVGAALRSLYKRMAEPEFDKASKKFSGPCFPVSSE